MWQDKTAKMVPCQDGHTGKQNEIDITRGGKWIERHTKTDTKKMHRQRHEKLRPKLINSAINSDKPRQIGR